MYKPILCVVNSFVTSTYIYIDDLHAEWPFDAHFVSAYRVAIGCVELSFSNRCLVFISAKLE